MPVNRHRSLLHHVFKHKPVWKRVIGLKASRTLPKTLSTDEIAVLIGACGNSRDKFLFALLYETGMRIGQALALRHEDIKSWDNEIHLVFRVHNANLARSKSRTPNVLHVSPELVQAYLHYTQHFPDLMNNNEYVFVNFIDKLPLCYSSVKKLFMRISKSTGIYVRPHMLRHPHATELKRTNHD